MVVPSKFHFEYVKSAKAKEGGIVLQSIKIYSDTVPVLVQMLKPGFGQAGGSDEVERKEKNNISFGSLDRAKR